MSEERVTYSTAKFYIEEGYYTLDELKTMIEEGTQQHERWTKALNHTMKKTNE